MFWYHSTTKHSYNSVRTNPNRLSWEDQPTTYKNYPDSYKKVKLDIGMKKTFNTQIRDYGVKSMHSKLILGF